MSKKLLAIFMALIMVLGSTVMAGAEEVPAETARMNEIAEEVIESLPEDLQYKDFEIVEGEDGGFSTALVASEPATAETVQGLIDDGTIVAGEFEIEGLNVEVVEMDAIVPFVEEDGELYNALNGRSANSYSSSYWSSGWYGDTIDGMRMQGRAYAYKYTDSSGNVLAVRPTNFGGMYTGSAFTVSKMITILGYKHSITRAYPAYLNGTDNSELDYDYSISGTQLNPTSGSIYSYYTGMSDECLQIVTGGPRIHIYLYEGSRERMDLVINLF